VSPGREVDLVNGRATYYRRVFIIRKFAGMDNPMGCLSCKVLIDYFEKNFHALH
jgi:hypothetical protein